MGRIWRVAVALLLAALTLPWPAPVVAARPAQAARVSPAGQRPQIEAFKDAAFLLPEGCAVQARWVLPPSSQKGLGMFSVDPAGNPVLAGGYPERILFPDHGYVVRLEGRNLKGLLHLKSGAMLLATGNEVGFLAPPKQKALDQNGVPLVDFQKLFATSLNEIDVFAANGEAVFVGGFSPSVRRHVLYALRTAQGAGFQDLERVFDSVEKITAATGDGDSVYVAVGRTVLRVSRRDGAMETVYRHPEADIRQLALCAAGLLASTGGEVVLVGPHGSLEILRSTGHSMCLRGETLYLLFSGSASVLALNNLSDLRRFNLAVRPAARGEGAAALSVTGVRFFESSPPPYGKKAFATSFPREGLRSIVGQIDLSVAGKFSAARRHTLTVNWYEPTGGRLLSANYTVRTAPGATGAQVLAAIGGGGTQQGYAPRPRGAGGWVWRLGPDSLGTRYPGRYTMTVQVDGVAAGEWSFEITGRRNLLEVLTYNDPAALRELLAGGLNVRTQDPDGFLPLNQAITFGSTEMVEMLLKAGADPNMKDKEGRPALACAWSQAADWQDKAELLLRHGANINATTDKDNTPLLYAQSFDHEYSTFLLERGADLNAVHPIWKASVAQVINPLHSSFCNAKSLSALVKRGVNLRTAKDTLGYSALGAAVFTQNAECVETLLGQEGVMLSFGQSRSNRMERSVLFIALENLDRLAPERLAKAVRIVRLLQKRQAFLRPGEGFVMFRGMVAPSLFPRETLLETLRNEETAMDEAYGSKLAELQDLALLASPEWVRRRTSLAESVQDLRMAHGFCQKGFKLAETRYQNLQVELQLDATGKPLSALGAALQDRSGGGCHVLRLLPGGVGERSGLRPGDILLELDGQKLGGVADAVQAVDRVKAAGRTHAVILRGDSGANMDLHLACGILESEIGEKGLAEMHLARWLADNPRHEKASTVREMLGR